PRQLEQRSRRAGEGAPGVSASDPAGSPQSVPCRAILWQRPASLLVEAIRQRREAVRGGRRPAQGRRTLLVLPRLVAAGTVGQAEARRGILRLRGGVTPGGGESPTAGRHQRQSRTRAGKPAGISQRSASQGGR